MHVVFAQPSRFNSSPSFKKHSEKGILPSASRLANLALGTSLVKSQGVCEYSRPRLS